MLLYQNRSAESFVNIFFVKFGRLLYLLFLCSCTGGERALPEMEVYKKRVAKSARFMSLWCALQVKAPMKVRRPEHKRWFWKKNLTSHCWSKWLAWRAHSTAGRDAEERHRSRNGVKGSSKPAITNHKGEPRLGVHVPQVPRHFDFFHDCLLLPRIPKFPSL